MSISIAEILPASEVKNFCAGHPDYKALLVSAGAEVMQQLEKARHDVVYGGKDDEGKPTEKWRAEGDVTYFSGRLGVLNEVLGETK